MGVNGETFKKNCNFVPDSKKFSIKKKYVVHESMPHTILLNGKKIYTRGDTIIFKDFYDKKRTKHQNFTQWQFFLLFIYDQMYVCIKFRY